MENLKIYEMGRAVPEEAKKPIAAGKLKGYSNINPMYRIKTLTEMFGPCGIGWWYKVTSQRLEGTPQGEIYAFVDIELYYKLNDVISQPVIGVGGSSFLTSTRNGPQASDECFKMALTDAISVAAKSLGVAADVYWQEDCTKYGDWGVTPPPYTAAPQPAPVAQAPAPAAPVYAQATAPQPQAYNAPAPATVPAVPQGQPTQTYVATTQPAPAPARPVLTQEQIDYVRAIVCDVGLKKNLPLGQVFDGPNARAELGTIIAQTRNPYVKDAAEALLSLLA